VIQKLISGVYVNQPFARTGQWSGRSSLGLPFHMMMMIGGCKTAESWPHRVSLVEDLVSIFAVISLGQAPVVRKGICCISVFRSFRLCLVMLALSPSVMSTPLKVMPEFNAFFRQQRSLLLPPCPQITFHAKLDRSAK